ncbi:MAG TPA: prevent-host-death protein [Clostridiales bacterium]|nr:prevent-host-death protein [Clostridiales bacterium]
MRIPSTEVQNNFGKYLNIAASGQEVVITRMGMEMARMVPCIPRPDEIEETSGAYSAGRGRRVSYEEFLELTRDLDQRFELIDGVVYKMDSPNYFHQSALLHIVSFLDNWFKGKKCRPVPSPFDITLVKWMEEKNVVQPDIVILCDPENIDENGKYTGIPTLVVELLSKTSRTKDSVKKLDLYLSTGIREFWLVDPVRKQCTVYDLQDQAIEDSRIFTGNETVSSFVFEGLGIPLDEIFSDKGWSCPP